jgi:hypothetical protein
VKGFQLSPDRLNPFSQIAERINAVELKTAKWTSEIRTLVNRPVEAPLVEIAMAIVTLHQFACVLVLATYTANRAEKWKLGMWFRRRWRCWNA